MGMDVYGKNPSSETGRYFRNNVWWWRPLWNYCCTVSPEARGVKYGHSNDGDGLDADGATMLAATLQAELDSGRTAEYERAYNARMKSMPDEPCRYCGGTGVRTDEVGVNHGMPERTIDEPGHPRHGQKGWCNGCDGKGTVRPFDTGYPFSEQNVREFAAFLRDSGGFEIF